MHERFSRARERLSKYALFRFAQKYAELIRYGLVGALTTGVDFSVYYIATRLLFPHLLDRNEELYAFVFNAAAWGIAVIFAFLANRIFVFQNRLGGSALLMQILSFVLLRLASGVLQTLTPSLLIRLGMHDLAAKAIVSLAVIVVNYLFSKFITFKKQKSAPSDNSVDL